MNTPKLETNRLILRKFNENDLKAFYDIFSDKEVNLYLPWFPVKNLKEAKDFYQERYVSIYQKEQGYAYAICLKENNLPIGYVNINLDESHDLGYGLKKNIGINMNILQKKTFKRQVLTNLSFFLNND